MVVLWFVIWQKFGLESLVLSLWFVFMVLWFAALVRSFWAIYYYGCVEFVCSCLIVFGFGDYFVWVV